MNDDPLKRFEALFSRITATLPPKKDPTKPPERKMPYYNNLQAEASRKTLDLLLEDPTARIRIPAYGVALATARNQFYQGCQFLMERLDTVGKYSVLKGRVKTKIQDGYLVVYLLGADIQQVELRVVGHAHDYSPDIDEFIQNATIGDRMPVKEPVLLTEDEVERYTNMFLPFEDSFLIDIQRNKLLIVRK
jgi:hypothetical protein